MSVIFNRAHLESIRSLWLSLVLVLFLGADFAHAVGFGSGDLPATPGTDFVLPGESSDLSFCSRWNPEFGLRQYFCCPLRKLTRQERRRCPKKRTKWTYCDEMTEDQRRYSDDVTSGRIVDPLQVISTRVAKMQAQCNASDGFLAQGRRLVPTKANRVKIRNPLRCADFGTDPLVGMIEWIGRKVNEVYSREYPGIQLVVGDLSAPRGGCLSGRGGRRGHASHTNGLDADIAFLQPRLGGRASPDHFDRHFDARANWWLLKQMFNNPYACVRAVFLDRNLIRKIGAIAANDPEWYRVSGSIKHIRGHRNHFHVRVGPGPGEPGCLGMLGEYDEDEAPEGEDGSDLSETAE